MEKAYALQDNPFRLADSLPADMQSDLRDWLWAAPLQMAKEERLVAYYCDKVYPDKAHFRNGTPFQAFERSMRDLGYNDKPKTLDQRQRSRIMLIRGPTGTGKTTLAHRMMRWLIDCDPQDNSWKEPVYWSPDSANDNARRQSASIIEKFKTAVMEQGKGRFLCLLDDVKKDAETQIFKVFTELVPDRTLFFFITSSDREIRAKNYSLNNPPVIVYDTGTLTPERAIQYCEARITPLRSDTTLSWLPNFPLFPLTKEIIQASLSPAAYTLWDDAGSVGLREFNVRFADLLDLGKDALPTEFDIAVVPAKKIVKYLIDPTKGDEERQVA